MGLGTLVRLRPSYDRRGSAPADGVTVDQELTLLEQALPALDDVQLVLLALRDLEEQPPAGWPPLE